MDALKRIDRRPGRWAVSLCLAAATWTGVAHGQAKKPQAAQAATAHVPSVVMTEELLRHIVLAEVAYLRGYTDAAVKTMLDIARKVGDPRLAQRAMEMSLERGQAARALNAVQLWLKLSPQSAEAKRYEELLNAALGRIEPLLPELAKQLAKAKGKDLDTAIGQVAGVVNQMPDKQTAFEHLQKLLAPYGETPSTQLVLARAAGLAEQFDLAEALARNALKLKPDSEYAALIAFDFGARRNLERAIERLSEFVQGNPQAIEARLALARGYLANQNPEQANRELETLLKVKPNHPEALYRLGMIAFQAQDWDTAEQHLLLYVEQSEKQTADAAYGLLAQIAEERKQYDQAIAWLDRIEEGDAAFLARLRTASVLGKQGKHEDAQALLGKLATPTSQHRVQVLLTRAQLMREQGEGAQAYALLEQELKQTSDNADLWYDYALLGERLGKFDEMEKALRKVITLRPDFAHAYNALGYSFADRNVRLEEAQQLLDKATALAPADAFIMDSSGWLQYRMGKFEDALKILRKAYALRPDPEIAIHLGEVLWVRGDTQEARRLWAEAKNKEPASPALKATLARFKVEL